MMQQKIKQSAQPWQRLQHMLWRLVTFSSAYALALALSGNHQRTVLLIGLPLLLIAFACTVCSQTRLPVQERIEIELQFYDK